MFFRASGKMHSSYEVWKRQVRIVASLEPLFFRMVASMPYSSEDLLILRESEKVRESGVRER